MSIQSEITRINNNVQTTLSTIAATGVAVASDANSDALPAAAAALANEKLSLSGGTMTGALTLAGNPTANLHPATKQYVDNKHRSYTVSISNSWSAYSGGGYYKTVSVSGILAADNPTADVVLGTDVAANALYKAAWALVDRIVTAANSITLYANTSAPTTAFTIQLKT